ncbi:hypothetical protein [Cryobacterium arcticum]|uniref:Uncharacterized protein n=1 Tax=Cryobacterium arcticum TaxID=670052 RepID=A0A317ZYZ2_9MICO|nr:hypothetical protein [Cryobacterium arcticum]PXA71871.1 hypothetical protein CTB96_02820 [Cryobacterium arcticum]
MTTISGPVNVTSLPIAPPGVNLYLMLSDSAGNLYRAGLVHAGPARPGEGLEWEATGVKP